MLEETVLIKAARTGKEDIVLQLLAAGAATEATNKVTYNILSTGIPTYFYSILAAGHIYMYICMYL